jgi:hypothetical protein
MSEGNSHGLARAVAVGVIGCGSAVGGAIAGWILCYRFYYPQSFVYLIEGRIVFTPDWVIQGWNAVHLLSWIAINISMLVWSVFRRTRWRNLRASGPRILLTIYAAFAGWFFLGPVVHRREFWGLPMFGAPLPYEARTRFWLAVGVPLLTGFIVLVFLLLQVSGRRTFMGVRRR